MVALTTPSLAPGFHAPDFTLKAVDGKTYGLKDIQGKKATLIMFICNHCPYVQAIIDRVVERTKELKSFDVGIAAIMSNDVIAYPQDNFENMKLFAQKHHFHFPYLWDETQSIAKAYDAVCTPEFYVFDQNLELQYRGRFDASRKELIPDAKCDLLEAIKLIVETGHGPKEQFPSMGCSIKWKD